MKPFMVVISAPSGAGKTSIAHRLVATRSDVGFSVSATTRRRRPGEKEGKAYHFITRERFAELRQRQAFVECAEYAGEWYGTLKSEVERVQEDLGRHVLLDIEVQGARQVRKSHPPPLSVSIFVLPPTPRALVQRLTRRDTESAESVLQRLAKAIEELRAAKEFDYIVVNERLPSAVAQVGRIIDAENLKTERDPDLGDNIDGTTEFLRKQINKIERGLPHLIDKGTQIQ